MGSGIPRPIKEQVIRKWLKGKFRDRIAEELKISQGSVSNIIRDFGSDDPDFCLLREVALEIKNQNIDVATFASLVRLLEVLKEKGLVSGITGKETLALMQARLEALVVALEVFCFRKNLPIEDFVNLVNDMYSAAEILSVPLDKFPDYIKDLKSKIDALLNDIDRLETKKQDVLKNYKMTSESLQEYRADKPLVLRIQKLIHELANAKEALENERVLNKIGEELEWSISEPELIKINTELGNCQYYDLDGTEPLSIGRLKEMVMEVYHRPSDYPELIRDMMYQYNLRHEKRKTQVSN